MKNILFIIVLLVFSCKNEAEQKKETATTETTYYFIRHAEKDKSDPTNKNPSLTKEGKLRAQNWANYFKTINLDAVYSTNYIRTMQTATPTAKEKQLDIKNYEPKQEYYQAFKAQNKGKNVLVVGHSNTTPQFVNAVINQNVYKDIDETENNNLFIVTINKDKLTHKKTKVN